MIIPCAYSIDLIIKFEINNKRLLLFIQCCFINEKLAVVTFGSLVKLSRSRILSCASE